MPVEVVRTDDGLTATIACSKVGMTHVVGKGGSTIKSIQADTSAKVETNADGDKGTVVITGGTTEAVNAAVAKVEVILAEQENPDYEGPEGSRLRAKADEHAKERSRLMELADKQFADGDKSAGHETMAKAKEEGELMKKVSAEAARVILDHRNGGKGDAYLDLHGLRVAEAEEFTNERLDALVAKSEGTDLELIPGAGHHSAPGKVALKPAMEKLLTERGLEYEEISAGSFNVRVKGTSGNYAVAGAATAAAADDEPEKKGEEKKDEEKKDEEKDEEKKDEEEKEKKGGCCIVM